MQTEHWLKQFRGAMGQILNDQQLLVLEHHLARALSTESDQTPLAERLGVSRQRVNQLWEESIDRLGAFPQIQAATDDAALALRHISEAVAHMNNIEESARKAVSSSVLATSAMHVAVRPTMRENSKVTPEMVPTRVYNRLKALGVRRIQDFAKVTEDDIRRIQGCGDNTVNELKNKLALYGVTLAR